MSETIFRVDLESAATILRAYPDGTTRVINGSAALAAAMAGQAVAAAIAEQLPDLSDFTNIATLDDPQTFSGAKNFTGGLQVGGVSVVPGDYARKANLDADGVVAKAGAQTVAGAKTFSDAMVVNSSLYVLTTITLASTLNANGNIVLAGNQTIGGTLGVMGNASFSTIQVSGVATFSSAPVIGGVSFNPANYVAKSGTETITGEKNFTGGLKLSGTLFTPADYMAKAGTETVTGAKTFSGGITVSTLSAGPGDRVQIPEGYYGNIHAGDDDTLKPTFAVSRQVSITAAQLTAAGITTTGESQLAAIDGSVYGHASCQVQPVGVRGVAYNAGNSYGVHDNARPDALGVSGLGIIMTGGAGVGIGGYFEGQREGSTGHVHAIEARTRNLGSDFSYNPATFNSCGIWISNLGNEVTAGVHVGNVVGGQYRYGFLATRQVAEGFTGAIRLAFLRDDSHAEWSYQIGGEHDGGIDTREATFADDFALVAGDTHKIGWEDAAIERGNAGVIKVPGLMQNGQTIDGLTAAGVAMVEAADVTAQRTLLEISAFRGAMVEKTTNQTGADFTTRTALTWDGESYDTSGFHDNVTSNDRLTVPSGVTKARLLGGIQITGLTADSWCRLSLEKNGSLDFDGVTQANTEVGQTTVTLNISSPVLAVTPGDYFKLTLVVETDTSIDITALRSWFAIEAIE